MPIVLLIAITMVAFAANSLLNRAGIHLFGMDAMAFAGVRLASGAVVLAGLVALRPGSPMRPAGGWRDRSTLAGAGWLLLYLVPFSLAYVQLPSGIGALILFGVVQLTMFAGAALAGAAPGPRQWGGMALAMAGLVWLLWPSDIPDGRSDLAGIGAVFMGVAGFAWGMFSLKGRGSRDPLADMARSFVLLLPVAGVLMVVGTGWSLPGVTLGILCGAVTSGLGYALWYRVLPQLAATTAAVAQLTVPVIALVAGAALLAEPLTAQVIGAAAIVLGGIAMTVIKRG